MVGEIKEIGYELQFLKLGVSYLRARYAILVCVYIFFYIFINKKRQKMGRDET